MDQTAVELLIKGYNREKLTREDCLYLLKFQEFSPEAIFTRDLFSRFFRENCNNTAEVGAQIGVYTGPCSGDCGFCNFGASHSNAKQYEMPFDTLKRYLDECTRYGDVRAVSLMTTHDCPNDLLVKYVEFTKEHILPGMMIMINTGDRTEKEFRELKKAGADSAYHVCRMGEGKDTSLAPEERYRTMKNIKDAGLSLFTCTEPIGSEHSDEDIVNNYFRGLETGCDCGHAALRMPVFGTPLGGVPTLSIKRYRQIQSVLGLATAWHSGGKRVTGWDTGYYTGDNSLSAELAASPRDSGIISEKSMGHDLAWCRRTLFGDGYDKIIMADGSVKPLDLDHLRTTKSI